jgi:xanthine/CO dehydrogenase XdhC/CoxF family maturation factor
MRLRLIRRATLRLRLAGRGVLVDPMLDGPDLPEPAEVVVKRLDAVLVTQPDHLDATAIELLPKDLPMFGPPELREYGFTDVRRPGDWDGVRIVNAGAGFVVAAADEPVLYVAGDMRWGDELAAALDEHRPDVVVVTAPTVDDVVAVARHAPDARVVVVVFDDPPHTRADLHQRLHEEELTNRVTVPEDGAEVPLDPPG